jgi:hypothetical protein
MRSSGLACLALCALGCAGPLTGVRRHRAVETPVGAVLVEYLDDDTAAATQIQSALARAGPWVSRWGALYDPVAVRVLPSHAALEDAVDRPGYGWLRAWARYDEVLVQSPLTWRPAGAASADVDELIVHELTHCVMYQLASTRSTWTRREIPLWFREGMAAVTARQGYRWPSLDELERFYATHWDEDPLTRPDSLYRDQSDWVYAVAYHAFAFLDTRYGDAAIRSTLRGMKAGGDFAGAFTAAVGITPDAFVAEFRRYVRWGGFRRTQTAVR